MRSRISAALTLCIMAATCVAAQTEKTPGRRFMVGYESGISFRYFPSQTYGFGLVVQPQIGNDLYSGVENDRSLTYASGTITSTRKTKRKGATVLFDIISKFPVYEGFHISPFISIGGGYYSYERYTRRTDHSGDLADTDDTEYTDETEYTSTSFVGQAGIMPGVVVGPFTAEFRLGIRGEIEKLDSHDDSDDERKEDNKRLGLLYPADIVKSLIVHISF